MGASIEWNDTLKLSKPDFPKELIVEEHQKNPSKIEQFSNKIYKFKKDGVRLFNFYPTRVLLVEDIGGKWVYWGQAMVVEQTIDALKKTTTGKYKIALLYDPDFQKNMTRMDSPQGKSFF